MGTTDHRPNTSVQYCFPDNNASCIKEVRTGPGNVLLYIFLSCVSVCTVFLNLLVIISISHFKQLHTPTNLLILSLAVADLLMGLFVMPVNIMELIDSCWYLGRIACAVFPLISYVSMAGSVCSVTLIAVDRYIAVSDPLRYITRITVCKTVLIIILGWFVCLSYTMIFMYFNDHLLQYQISFKCYGECVLVIRKPWVITDLVVSFLTPCSIILVLYSIIFAVARQQGKAVRAMRQRGKDSSSSESKAAKTLGIVVFVYLACWIQFYLSSLCVESLTSSSVVWTVIIWIVYINSSVNPLMYAIFYPWFRQSAKHILICRIFHSSSSSVNLFPK